MDITELKPTKGYSVIQVLEKPDEAGGLVLVNSESNAAPVIGTVVRESDGSPFKEGMQVVFRKYAIDELNWTGENGLEQKVYVLDNKEILATINPNNHADEKATRRVQIEERRRYQEGGEEGGQEGREKSVEEVTPSL